MRISFGTARRLFVAFATLVSSFAAASYVALDHVREMHEGLVQMKRHEEGVRLSLELASAVRDQYAHEAHTIILGDTTHLPYYTAAKERVVALTSLVKQHAVQPDERSWVQDIERATGDLDRVFRERIVPAVLEAHQADVRKEHGRTQLLVTAIQDRADRLADRFETSIAEFQRQASALQRATFHWTILFVVGAPLLAVMVGAYVVRSVAVPVARLQDGAARIARGELDTHIQIDTTDEFGVLARQFNAMTRALKEHQQQLVEHEKLAGIGRLAAGVAHEINNPLAVILGYARLLRRRSQGPLAGDLQIIEDETMRAKLIVDALLDLSRPLELEPEPVDLRALCDETVRRLDGIRLLDGVTVKVTGEGRVAGDPQKLRQVVLNLVKNAAEAAGPGGHIDVAVAADRDGARVRVLDSGAGLTGEARGHLFEPFYTTKETGTGLGLAVSKGIVEAHGGTIHAEAGSGAGGGACFEVRLPAAPRGRV